MLLLMCKCWIVGWVFGTLMWSYWVERCPRRWDPSNIDKDFSVMVVATLLSPLSIILMFTDLLIQRRKLHMLENRLAQMKRS